jgi:hypothetical protein
MEKKAVSPMVIVIAIAVVLALVGYFGYRTTVAPKPYTSGVGADGKPMSQQQIDELARRMSGGRVQGAPAGSTSR